MLTDSEREWVRENKTRTGCIRCRYTCFEPPHCPVIPTKEDLIDVADFEARVAAKLAEMPFRGLSQYDIFEELKKTGKPFAWIALRNARLAVEEEIDESKDIER